MNTELKERFLKEAELSKVFSRSTGKEATTTRKTPDEIWNIAVRLLTGNDAIEFHNQTNLKQRTMEVNKLLIQVLENQTIIFEDLISKCSSPLRRERMVEAIEKTEDLIEATEQTNLKG